MAARLFVILAREARIGVIFRRGPSRQVLPIRWDLRRDRFEQGQWFKGRIYERRCDLSPDGELLIYFAANHKPPYGSWTAISKPPWLTALSLWPKGNCWDGGGLFTSRVRIELNHWYERALADGFRVPSRMIIEKSQGLMGEDWPIYGRRLERDGWRCVQTGRAATASKRDLERVGLHYRYDPPIIHERIRTRVRPKHASLRMITEGLYERNGPWYRVSYAIVGDAGEITPLGRADWADWDWNGDLLFAKTGKLFRLKPSGIRARAPRFDPAAAREIADFNALTFEAREAPPEARRW